ncbi:leucine-rich repeat-containing protein 34 isoform X1 [Scleropages formosus]|uniref:leucine-rich repeat-containing protein 34 isoform X1 n=1 Tax=Scleropages formosus TaxID=113540 RepID=UPI0008780769|nr:leucine-rich repeat-containing protein 34 isoform X1 [Scleropages formosus]
MTSREDRYLAACAQLALPTNPYVARVLRGSDQGATSSGSGLIIRLPGNERLPPVQRLTDRDALALCGALRGHVVVADLDLSFNRMTDTGAKYIAELLQDRVDVKSLDLSCNDIEADGAEHLAKRLQVGGRTCTCVSFRCAARTLTLHCWLLGASFVFKRNGSLRTLRMKGNKIGDKGGMNFADMLQSNSTLEEMDLSDCDLATQSLIAFAVVLSKNKTIRAINVSRPLLYSHQEETTVYFAQMLQVNQSLRELHLAKHGMTDSGVERLCETLRDNVALRYLDLRCNRITRDGAKHLAEVLKQNRTLEVLDLSSNRIEDDGAVHLSGAIMLHNHTLKALSITSNNIGSQGLVSLTKAMAANSALSHIYIWGNKLEEPVCVAIAGLIQSRRLQEEATDVSPYQVDGHMYLAEVNHRLRGHY